MGMRFRPKWPSKNARIRPLTAAPFNIYFAIMWVESSLVAVPDWGLHCYERRKASSHERKRRSSLDLNRDTRTDKSPRHSGKSSPSEFTEALFTEQVDTRDSKLLQTRENEPGFEIATCEGAEVFDAKSIRAAIESDSEPDGSSSPSLEPVIPSNRPLPAAEVEWATALHSANQKIKTELVHVKAQQDQAR